MPKQTKALKPIPKFRSHEEAGEFWMTHDTTEYLDWSKARRVRFSKLRPSTATISLRLPQMLLDDLRILANQRDVPYQSLLKVYLAERVAAERGQSAASRPNTRLQPAKVRRGRSRKAAAS
jgi:predicted DNA binding CopG/RHH family protein